jgi:hypothetical protein
VGDAPGPVVRGVALDFVSLKPDQCEARVDVELICLKNDSSPETTKLVAEGKSDKVEGKVENAVGGLKDAVRDALKE